MSSAKQEILDRIQNALKDIPPDEKPDDITVDRSYRTTSDDDQDILVNRFAQRVGEYKATVQRVSQSDVLQTIKDSCKREKVQQLVIPPGLAKELYPNELDLLKDTHEVQLTHHQLDDADGVLTTCALAVAETGTIILDAGEGQGRRALTLLPDYHLCVVYEDQIVGIFPEAIRHFEEKMQTKAPPMTLISGPSATSDIELNRVEGVHGPRRLEVLIVEE